jgi:alkanesulfonate monooxygenase SsuD/methylene tetrahydromethanopterin reductase-like flavin-dependent oxidoreductase (luciferase family)
VEIDVGLDTTGLGYDDEMQVAAEAARQGYGRMWIGSIGDPFQACALRWSASRDAVRGGIGTAIGVVPIGAQTPASLALSAAALSRLTGGRFILGIGSGALHEPAYRRTWGIMERSPLALTRAYLETIRGLLAGQPVTQHGSGISYDGARLPGEPASTPLYLGAGGPEMTRLGGELADGVYLSWCTPGSVQATRERMTEGAARAGRDPAALRLAASVRACIDDEVPAARRALARALLPYVLGWGGPPPAHNRANFERMGFGAEIAELYQMNDRGLSRTEIIEAFPERMLRGLGYFGPAAGAAYAVQQQVAGADIAVVRVVPSGAGVAPIRSVLTACLPVRAG